MENQISNGAMLGIVLLALAVVIGLGFSIFAIARGTANEGVANLQDSLGQVSESAFVDFNQKIVTGTQVNGAYKSLQGKPYAILIRTSAYAAGRKDGLNSTTENKIIVTSGSGSNIMSFLNYNALLAGSGATETSRGTVSLTYENGVYVTSNGFYVTAGKINFNSEIGNLSKSGMAEYIPTSGKFQANLIKDTSGTIMGIVFEQIKQ